MRAAQLDALSDPDCIKVLVALASSPVPLPTVEVAVAVSAEVTRTSRALDRLVETGLVTPHRGPASVANAAPGVVLTADAWLRFGSLLVDTSARPQPDAATPQRISRMAEQLYERHSAHFSLPTVRGYVEESYALLAERAMVTTYLPTLVYRFAEDRLAALARAEGRTPSRTPEVLFVCVHNAARSQMAAAMLRHRAGRSVLVRTAGSRPASRISPVVIEALDEIGVPVAHEFPKPLTDEVVRASDVVVTMGCGEACPVYSGRRYVAWELDDPLVLPMDGVRRVRDEISTHIGQLLEDLDSVPVSSMTT
ncbi:arsenate reductase ArsC [Demequina sp. NBRC 110053]|uniref:arsenate reductase ArsC n=1 Tax=Demequina sp. NBRC 110053 TaxID=1570342 RepID=UPI001F231D56|nr:arsenate reductase ArsC [Demequina sp. NBRC 110053]